MEFRLEFTVADHGYEPANGERMLDGFMAVYPEGGPSVIQSVKDGSMTVTVGLDAEHFADAAKRGSRLCMDAFRRSGLGPTSVITFTVAQEVATESTEADAVLAIA